MRIALIMLALIGVLALSAGAFWLYTERVANPRVARDLVENPDGERARRVMLITLPSARRLPVNYLRKEEWVFAGADGTWWRELGDGGAPVTVVVRGKVRTGHARAVLEDPERRQRVFEELRPDALEGFGTLVEIRLDPDASGSDRPMRRAQPPHDTGPR